jgi:plastocyanin
MARPGIAPALLLALACCESLAGTVTLTVRDAAGAPVAGAVVFLEGGARATAPAGASAVIDQRDKAFVPQVTVVQAGTEISFPNSDAVSHHVYSFARPNAFELPLYKGGTRPKLKFDHPGVVTLGCNIHDAMVGYVVVVETPYFATADEAGRVVLPGVAPGSYVARVWSPRLDPPKPLAGPALEVGAQPIGQDVSVARRMRALPSGGALAASDY